MWCTVALSGVTSGHSGCRRVALQPSGLHEQVGSHGVAGLGQAATRKCPPCCCLQPKFLSEAFYLETMKRLEYFWRVSVLLLHPSPLI